MARVLVIDADPDLRVLMGQAFEASGHHAILAGSARSGLELAATLWPDLIVIDAGMKDADIAQVVASLKQDERTQNTPFIVARAHASERDRIRGLELGAEDVVSKPLSIRELLLRAQVVLRRLPGAGSRARTPRCCGALTLEPETHRFRLGGHALSLTPLEHRLLLTLAGRSNHVQSRETLLLDVWGVHPDLKTRTVDVHVKRLREKLGAWAWMIETVRGVGYRLRDDGPQPES